jgi:Protein of unknown function (DUF550)
MNSTQLPPGGETTTTARTDEVARLRSALAGRQEEIGRLSMEVGRLQAALLEVGMGATKAGTIPAQPHPDDFAVDSFAAAMKAKMAKQRAKGYGGWDQIAACTDKSLADKLMQHTKRGDPVDVANFCMMLHQRNQDQIDIAVGTLRGASLDFAKRVASMWIPEVVAGDAPAQQEEPFDFHAHLARQAAFSLKTFGPGTRTAGVCDHIRKELIEVEADPTDLAEWVDVIILALDGAWRCGAKPVEIINGIVAKQIKNEGRAWPDWRTADPTKAIEHDRSGEQHRGVAPACAICDNTGTAFGKACCCRGDA